MNNDRNMTCGVATQAGSLADSSLHGKGSLFGMIKTSRMARIAVTALLALAGVAMFPVTEANAQATLQLSYPVSVNTSGQALLPRGESADATVAVSNARTSDTTAVNLQFPGQPTAGNSRRDSNHTIELANDIRVTLRDEAGSAITNTDFASSLLFDDSGTLVMRWVVRQSYFAGNMGRDFTLRVSAPGSASVGSTLQMTLGDFSDDGVNTVINPTAGSSVGGVADRWVVALPPSVTAVVVSGDRTLDESDPYVNNGDPGDDSIVELRVTGIPTVAGVAATTAVRINYEITGDATGPGGTNNFRTTPTAGTTVDAGAGRSVGWSAISGGNTGTRTGTIDISKGLIAAGSGIGGGGDLGGGLTPASGAGAGSATIRLRLEPVDRNLASSVAFSFSIASATVDPGGTNVDINANNITNLDPNEFTIVDPNRATGTATLETVGPTTLQTNGAFPGTAGGQFVLRIRDYVPSTSAPGNTATYLSPLFHVDSARTDNDAGLSAASETVDRQTLNATNFSLSLATGNTGAGITATNRAIFDGVGNSGEEGRFRIYLPINLLNANQGNVTAAGDEDIFITINALDATDTASRGDNVFSLDSITGRTAAPGNTGNFVSDAGFDVTGTPSVTYVFTGSGSTPSVSLTPATLSVLNGGNTGTLMLDLAAIDDIPTVTPPDDVRMRIVFNVDRDVTVGAAAKTLDLGGDLTLTLPTSPGGLQFITGTSGDLNTRRFAINIPGGVITSSGPGIEDDAQGDAAIEITVTAVGSFTGDTAITLHGVGYVNLDGMTQSGGTVPHLVGGTTISVANAPSITLTGTDGTIPAGGAGSTFTIEVRDYGPTFEGAADFLAIGLSASVPGGTDHDFATTTPITADGGATTLTGVNMELEFDSSTDGSVYFLNDGENGFYIVLPEALFAASAGSNTTEGNEDVTITVTTLDAATLGAVTFAFVDGKANGVANTTGGTPSASVTNSDIADDRTTGDVTFTIAARTTAELSALTLAPMGGSTVTLTPDFDTATFDYAASLPVGTTSAEVTATRTDGSSFTINDASGASGTASTISNLTTGANTITIVVTAEDGNTMQTYTITATVAALSSTDASLSALTVDGVPVTNPAASGACGATPCAVTIGSDALATVVATPTSAVATITMITGVQMDGTTVLGGIDTSARTGASNRGVHTVMLTGLSAPGNNTITILVTAEDATTIRTYTITATVIDPATAITLRWRDNESEVAVGTPLNIQAAVPTTSVQNFVGRSPNDGEGPLYLELPDTVMPGDVIEVQYEVRSADGTIEMRSLFITVPASSTP